MSDKTDFTNRMGKAMISLAAIGNTRELTLSDRVRTCGVLQGSASSDQE
ncbi:hypothetical protein MKK69_20290 [Methylobacterium sp. J-026]|nr:hypothetical protein [Methylobacterium sp. J-026]MCJ2136360.1 hypothetical protein [Methylobacterium sp. J-026]